MSNSAMKSEQDWQRELSPEQYRILREKGTELPFSGKYYDCTDNGMYLCAGCGNKLFSSEAKFDSGSGWPSFFGPVEKQNVCLNQDLTHGMVRTEVTCSRCGGHLGHVFDDGPQLTGKRFCINSGALQFHQESSVE